MVDENKKKMVLQYFYKKIPNALLPDHIANGLNMNKEMVEVVLDELLQQELIESGTPSPHHPGRITYQLVDEPKNYPSDVYVKIGDYNIPRLLDMDVARAEDTNQLIEALQKFTQKLEDKFQAKLDSQIRRFYGNLVAIFGVFIAIFALIMTAVGVSINIPMPPDITQAVTISFAIFAPLFVALIIFIIGVWILNKALLK